MKLLYDYSVGNPITNPIAHPIAIYSKHVQVLVALACEMHLAELALSKTLESGLLELVGAKDRAKLSLRAICRGLRVSTGLALAQAARRIARRALYGSCETKPKATNLFVLSNAAGIKSIEMLMRCSTMCGCPRCALQK